METFEFFFLISPFLDVGKYMATGPPPVFWSRTKMHHSERALYVKSFRDIFIMCVHERHRHLFKVSLFSSPRGNNSSHVSQIL